MDILIVGYGNIGKHIYNEFKMLRPDVYDPHIPEHKTKQDKHYDLAFICVPIDSLPDGSCDTSDVGRMTSSERVVANFANNKKTVDLYWEMVYNVVRQKKFYEFECCRPIYIHSRNEIPIVKIAQL